MIGALATALALGATACGGNSGSSATTGTIATSVGTSTATTGTAPSLTLAPPVVLRGDLVSIKGSAGGCTAGDTVSVISKAFVHTQDFAGLPAVAAKVENDGSFSATTKIPAKTKPGRYEVTARCGGGNLGILAHLTVRRRGS